jgi:small subunit ribosomal protein S17
METTTTQSALVKRQQFKGIVTSDKMDKTVVVKVDVKKRHPKYHKAYTVSKKYKAHDAENQYKIGDLVVIEAIRPMSKDKKFQVIKKA